MVAVAAVHRSALGRAGGSLPTREVLDFAAAHAAARDAVHEELQVEPLQRDIESLGTTCVSLWTRAKDRVTYLQRPDLGRCLDDESRERLRTLDFPRNADVSLIVADGLSSPAAQRGAGPLLAALLPKLHVARLTVAPVCIVRQARVAVEDEIGWMLGAQLALILIGERPGLGTAESLGGYLVYQPRIGGSDAERNCVSNIRAGGLEAPAAAETLTHLIVESLRRKVSGISLKDYRALSMDGPAHCASGNPTLDAKP